MAILKSSSELFITLYFRLGSDATVALHFLKEWCSSLFMTCNERTLKEYTDWNRNGWREGQEFTGARRTADLLLRRRREQFHITSSHHIITSHPRNYVIGTVST